MILNLLLITTIIVYVWDFLGAPLQILSSIYSVLFGKEVTPDRVKLPKPWSCSLCMTFYITLFTQIVILPFSFTGFINIVFISLLFSWSTRPIYQIINILDKLIHNILAAIEKWTETAF